MFVKGKTLTHTNALAHIPSSLTSSRVHIRTPNETVFYPHERIRLTRRASGKRLKRGSGALDSDEDLEDRHQYPSFTVDILPQNEE